MFFQHLDQEIKDKLQLFQNPEFKVADQALYEEAYFRLFNEALLFIAENNTTFNPDEISTDAPTSESFSQLFSYLIVIPNWESKLSKRLEFYLNNWLITKK